LEATNVEDIGANVAGRDREVDLVLGVADQRPDTLRAGRGALDGRDPAQQGLDLAVLDHFARQTLVDEVVIRLPEDLVGVAALPLAPILVEFGRLPAGEDVIGHVIVGVREAGKDVSVGDGQVAPGGSVQLVATQVI
jgi:hypothetical protein